MKKVSTILALASIFTGANGQFQKIRVYQWSEQVCRSTIIFDTDGKFYGAFDCESHRVISYGNYRLTGNQIQIQYRKTSEISPTFIVDSTNLASNSKVKFTFLDKFSRPITDNLLSIDIVSKNGKFFKETQLDSTGTISVDESEISYLRINGSYPFTGNPLKIPMSKFNIKVQVMLPKELLGENYPKEYLGPPERLTLKGNRLIENSDVPTFLEIEWGISLQHPH